jgi:hypothetical protein
MDQVLSATDDALSGLRSSGVLIVMSCLRLRDLARR